MVGHLVFDLFCFEIYIKEVIIFTFRFTFFFILH
jgi:hypothetical protein